MKVIQFTPPPVGKAAPERPRAGLGAGPADFDKALSEALTAARPPARDAVVDENLRASGRLSEMDLSQAAGLLSSLLGSVRASTPESLAKVHDLDGVLCYFRV
ncbi:MAG: hypothetical protein LBW85_00755 [Deltaproteobacteria bacterium]|jgi:hypothetical protein|nr:hypothetical protein [Deltaproteobacteria bacterium]